MSVLSKTRGVIGIDLETTVNFGKNSDPHRDRILSVAVSDGEEEILLEGDFGRLVPLLKNPDILKVIHGASFDLKFLYKNLDILPDTIWDSLIIERTLYAGDINYQHGLQTVLARRQGVYLNKTVRDQFKDHSGRMTEEQRTYALDDVRHLPLLYEQQLEHVGKLALGRVAALENKLVPIVATMELRGLAFDRELWNSHLTWIEGKVSELERILAKAWDIPYMNSLFDDKVHLLDKLGHAETVRQYLASVGVDVSSTGKDILKANLHKHESVQQLLDWRTWSKLASWGYDKYVNPATGMIHPSWNQVGTVTGRFSSSNPNMQNVPRPQEGGPNLRHLFIPRDGYVYVVADYSQQEMRIYAQLCQDPALLEGCQEADIYLAFAPVVYGEAIDKDDPRRYDLKQGILAAGYGAGTYTLMNRMGASEENVLAFKRKVANGFPGMRRWREGQLRETLWRGLGRTLLGRARHFDCEFYNGLKNDDGRKGKIRNEIINQPVQGSAADMFKLAMVSLFKELGPYDAYIHILVHDEIVVEVKKSQAEYVRNIVQHVMETAGAELCPDVSMPAEAKITERWSK
jgi:DNA polymerase I-like protein with 3'-5' exonuclease and polymerase domains